MRLNENVFNLDFKTLRDGELKTVVVSAFQTVLVAQRKARFAHSVFVEGTVSGGKDDDRSVCTQSQLLISS